MLKKIMNMRTRHSRGIKDRATSRDLGMAGLVVCQTLKIPQLPTFRERGLADKLALSYNYYVYNATTYFFPRGDRQFLWPELYCDPNGIKGTKASGTVTIHGYSNSILEILWFGQCNGYTPCLTSHHSSCLAQVTSGSHTEIWAGPTRQMTRQSFQVSSELSRLVVYSHTPDFSSAAGNLYTASEGAYHNVTIFGSNTTTLIWATTRGESRNSLARSKLFRSIRERRAKLSRLSAHWLE